MYLGNGEAFNVTGAKREEVRDNWKERFGTDCDVPSMSSPDFKINSVSDGDP